MKLRMNKSTIYYRKIEKNFNNRKKLFFDEKKLQFSNSYSKIQINYYISTFISGRVIIGVKKFFFRIKKIE